MSELSWITQLKDEPIALLVLVIMAVFKVAETIIKFLIPHFKKTPNEPCAAHENRLKKIEGLLHKDMLKRKERQERVDKMMRDITIQSCAAVIYNSETPPLELFKAAMLHFRNDGNGNAREQVLKVITQDKQNIKLWKSVINEDAHNNGICENRHFLSCLEWIEKRIA